MSPTTFKSTGVGHFGAKFAKRGVDRFKTNFKMMWDRRWLSYAKKIVLISSAVWARYQNPPSSTGSGNYPFRYMYKQFFHCTLQAVQKRIKSRL